MGLFMLARRKISTTPNNEKSIRPLKQYWLNMEYQMKSARFPARYHQRDIHSVWRTIGNRTYNVSYKRP